MDTVNGSEWKMWAVFVALAILVSIGYCKWLDRSCSLDGIMTTNGVECSN